MGLIERLARFGHACPCPLVAVAPGATAIRLAVERELRIRGGRVARSAAEADTLLVCGSVSAEFHETVERIWGQLPSPKARVAVAEPAGVAAALRTATTRLSDVGLQRESAARRTEVRREQDAQPEDDGESEEMSMPGGLMMADRGADRDGLMLDQLHVRLGPVLPEWPAGLMVATTLQGDVIQAAEVETVPAGPLATGPGFWDEPVGAEWVGPRSAAANLDSASRVLALAGWQQAATSARRLRDALLGGAIRAGEVAALARGVRRSRTLRWLLAGIAPVAGEDAWLRLVRWVDGAAEAARSPRAAARDAPGTLARLEALPAMVTGLDLASARLAIASLDPDLDQLLGVPAGATHG